MKASIILYLTLILAPCLLSKSQSQAITTFFSCNKHNNACGRYYYPHSTDEEIGAQRSQAACQRTHSKQQKEKVCLGLANSSFHSTMIPFSIKMEIKYKWTISEKHLFQWDFSLSWAHLQKVNVCLLEDIIVCLHKGFSSFPYSLTFYFRPC